MDGVDVEVRLARIEEQLKRVRDELADLARAIHGPNGSIRNRLHKIENDAAAAKVAVVTLEQVRKERAEAMEQARLERGEGLTKKQVGAMLVFGAVASLGTVVSIAVAVSQLGGGA